MEAQGGLGRDILAHGLVVLGFPAFGEGLCSLFFCRRRHHRGDFLCIFFTTQGGEGDGIVIGDGGCTAADGSQVYSVTCHGITTGGDRGDAHRVILRCLGGRLFARKMDLHGVFGGGAGFLFGSFSSHFGAVAVAGEFPENIIQVKFAFGFRNTFGNHQIVITDDDLTLIVLVAGGALVLIFHKNTSCYPCRCRTAS